MSFNMTRRSFMEKSSKGLITMGLVPCFLSFDPDRAFAMPDSAGITLTDSYNHFGVSEEMIRQVMNEVLS